MLTITYGGVLLDPTPAANNHFGSAATVSPDGLMLVASSLNGSVGKVHTLSFSGSWSASKPALALSGSGQNFGAALSLRSDKAILVVGANTESVEGIIRLYEDVSGAWGSEIYFAPSLTVSGWGLGLHLLNDYLEYANPLYDNYATNSGSLLSVKYDSAGLYVYGDVANATTITANEQAFKALDVSGDGVRHVVGGTLERVQVIDRIAEQRPALLALRLTSNVSDASTYNRASAGVNPSFVGSPTLFGAGCASFNGTTQNISYNSADFNLLQRRMQEVELWFYTTSNSAVNSILQYGIFSSNNWRIVLYIANGVLTLYSRGATSANVVSHSLGAVTLNAWHHVRLRWVWGRGCIVYLDGVRVGTDLFVYTASITSYLYFGFSTGAYFNGYMRDIIVYDGGIHFYDDGYIPATTFSGSLLAEYITWTAVQILTDSTGVAGDQFGAVAVAITPDKSTIFVGAANRASGQGYVVIYDLNDTTGQYVERVVRLQSPSPVAGELYGSSLAASDINLLVGAPGYSGAFSLQGAIFYYNYLTTALSRPRLYLSE